MSLTAPPEAVDAGVIEEARRRQRRRRLRALAASLALVALTAVVLAGLGGGRGGRPPHGGAPVPVAPAHLLDSPRLFARDSLLARDVYAGVACRVPSSIACDRLGLAVWLRQPAVSVRATIGGRTVTLDDPAWSGPEHGGQRTAFAGFLQPAGLVRRLGITPSAHAMWSGRGPRSAPLVLRVTDAHGASLTIETTVEIAPGWG